MKQTQLRRKTPMKKVNPERKARELLRAYGPPARREWVKALPCSVPGCPNHPSENAHVNPEGRPSDGPSGIARKHDYTQIVPLCRHHHDQYHDMGQRSFNDKHGIDVDFVACYIESRWQDEQDN